MTFSEFQRFEVESLDQYIADISKGLKITPEEARKMGTVQFKELLPRGIDTENHWVCTVVDENRKHRVGSVWYGVKTTGGVRSVFIYDILIDAEFRHQGYGRLVMRAIELRAKKLGIDRIGLHVFGHNEIARNFYEKLGYQLISTAMRKDIF